MKTHRLVVHGVPYKNAKTAAALYDVPIDTYYSRVHRGWTPAQALNIDPPPEGARESDDIAKHAAMHGLKAATVRRRMAHDLTLEEACSFPPGERVRHPVRYQRRLYPSIAAFARALHLDNATAHRLIKDGHPLDIVIARSRK